MVQAPDQQLFTTEKAVDPQWQIIFNFNQLHINIFQEQGSLGLQSSEEVGRGRPWRYDALRVRDGAEQLGLSSADVLEDHDGGDVSAAVAVVGG